MIVIQSQRFPFKGFGEITIYPFLFHNEPMTTEALNYENTHARQQLELLLVGFYLAYFIEWVFRGFDYDRISFEKEAYAHQTDNQYVNNRKLYAMWRKTPAK